MVINLIVKFELRHKIFINLIHLAFHGLEIFSPFQILGIQVHHHQMRNSHMNCCQINLIQFDTFYTI